MAAVKTKPGAIVKVTELPKDLKWGHPNRKVPFYATEFKRLLEAGPGATLQVSIESACTSLRRHARAAGYRIEHTKYFEGVYFVRIAGKIDEKAECAKQRTRGEKKAARYGLTNPEAIEIFADGEMKH